MDGIAGFDSGYICVGSSVGSVAVIHCPTSDGERMSFQQPLVTKAGQAVTQCASSIDMLVVGNEQGDLFLFSTNVIFELQWEFPGVGYPCTALGMKDSVVVAGFSSGHIRIFRSDIREMSIELCAHARIINAVCVHPTLSMFVSCGDDQFLNVWSLPSFRDVSSSAVELLSSERIPNRLLTGVAFFPDDKIGVTSYDEDDLVILSKNS